MTGLTTQEILLKHVCPAVGDVIALIMFSSPLRAVLTVQRNKSLGELNPLPFIAMATNCFAWILYGFLTTDFYIYIGNVPGLLFGMFFVMTCYKYSKEQAQDMLRNILLGAFAFFFVIGLAQLAANLNFAATKTLWGSTCVAILGVYYTAPLSSLAKVVAQRDSSSLHWPLCGMNIINGMLWFAYGMAIRDWFVGLPNGIGAAFNVVCLAFCFIFPAKSRGSRLHGEIDPAANWGVLRLQSVRHPQTGAPLYHGSPATEGGFFDVTQFRWRTGGPGSFIRMVSSLRLGSRTQSQLAAGAGAGGSFIGTASVPARLEGSVREDGQQRQADSPDTGTPDCNVQGLEVVHGVLKGGSGRSSSEIAAGGDLEAGRAAEAAAAVDGNDVAGLGRQDDLVPDSTHRQ